MQVSVEMSESVWLENVMAEDKTSEVEGNDQDS